MPLIVTIRKGAREGGSYHFLQLARALQGHKPALISIVLFPNLPAHNAYYTCVNEWTDVYMDEGMDECMNCWEDKQSWLKTLTLQKT